MVRAPEDWRKTLRQADAFVRRRDRRALDLLLPALRWRDDKARGKAVALLVRLGPIAVPDLFRTLERATTAVERRGAVDALGGIGDSRAVPRIMRRLDDPAMSVRRSAMVALLRLEAMDAVPRIAQRLRDRSGGVRVAAAVVLGRFGDPRAVRPLIEALRDPMWYVRQAAATALGEIGDLRAVRALEVASRDPRKAVARAAAAALRAIRA